MLQPVDCSGRNSHDLPREITRGACEGRDQCKAGIHRNDDGGRIMSPKYKQVLYWYKTGVWDEQKVHNAVVKGWITAAEYELITGEPYVE